MDRTSVLKQALVQFLPELILSENEYKDAVRNRFLVVYINDKKKSRETATREDVTLMSLPDRRNSFMMDLCYKDPGYVWVDMDRSLIGLSQFITFQFSINPIRGNDGTANSLSQDKIRKDLSVGN